MQHQDFSSEPRLAGRGRPARVSDRRPGQPQATAGSSEGGGLPQPEACTAFAAQQAKKVRVLPAPATQLPRWAATLDDDERTSARLVDRIIERAASHPTEANLLEAFALLTAGAVDPDISTLISAKLTPEVVARVTSHHGRKEA